MDLSVFTCSQLPVPSFSEPHTGQYVLHISNFITNESKQIVTNLFLIVVYLSINFRFVPQEISVTFFDSDKPNCVLKFFSCYLSFRNS